MAIAIKDGGVLARAQKALTFAASLAASAVVARTIINDFVPVQVQDYIYSTLSSFFSRRRGPPQELTLVIEQNRRHSPNEVYDAVEAYLGALVSPSTTRLQVVKEYDQSNILVTVDSGEEVVEVFHGVEFRWRLISYARKRDNGVGEEDVKLYELTFHRRHREAALGEYLTHVLDHWKTLKEGERILQLHMLRFDEWSAVNLDHPSTFDTVAMDPDLKKALVADLERFVRRREYYRRIGKAWKRGYLLYGPPGTGKSSMVAAMANYLRFDVYDLELTGVRDNTTLRNILLETGNRSILVVEDIDCTIKIQNREYGEEEEQPTTGVTLSGLLNFVDGVWSSCGDERIIVFTTNHPERLDPALLRPGRMDMHVHLSYCTPGGFRTLARNYHCVDDHPTFGAIERMMAEEVDVTPAEVTGELMKSEDADEAFELLVTFMEEKKKDPARRKGSKAEESEGDCVSEVDNGGGSAADRAETVEAPANVRIL